MVKWLLIKHLELIRGCIYINQLEKPECAKSILSRNTTYSCTLSNRAPGEDGEVYDLKPGSSFEEGRVSHWKGSTKVGLSYHQHSYK